ncbi:hypothetical protein BJ878DRAFT_480018 [Calycina marina]|uniref:Oxidoreductase AflY n=1 Tax=Calycina marina TaxID=1763456 RepID=A0A9P7Z3A5_9HELO|nr:hypothetical protein BJ878DRAFT_480018 [Calycina marina]
MSAPMIAWVPVVNRIYRYLTAPSNRGAQYIDLPSVQVHDVETAPEKRPRTLKHLIRANHSNYSIIYHHGQFHNHMNHLLGSAYLFGATVEQLQTIYDEESEELEAWQDSPNEILVDDWRDYLGNKKYQRAYVDFFEDQLALEFDYDWKKVIEAYLFAGKEPLVNGLIGGLGHPLIHLSYAYELQNKELAMEALGMTSVCYDFLHKYLDDPRYTKAPTYSTTSPLEILYNINADTRLDGVFDSKGYHNMAVLFKNHEDIVMEHWNGWTITNPTEQFRQSQEAAVALLVRTVDPGTHGYDFFLCHVLTTSHAIRILLPLIPKRFHVTLVREWWLLTISVYIAQLRPKIDGDIKPSPTKQWAYVKDKALNSPWSGDAHYVKALRAMREAAFTWGDTHEYYLSAAVTLADDFHGWTGNTYI